MKWNWKLPAKEKIMALAGRYKWGLLVLAAGLLLLLWPAQSQTQSKESPKGEEQLAGEESFSLEDMEKRLSQALSEIQGAGEVQVLLTLDQGVERVLASDSIQEDGAEEQSTVILEGDEGEEAVLITQYYPSFQGALVVCPGGNDPQVRLQITQAVSALTGLGSDRISVCAGG